MSNQNRGVDGILWRADLNAPNLQIKGSSGVPTNLKLNQYIEWGWWMNVNIRYLTWANAGNQKPEPLKSNLKWNFILITASRWGPYYTTTHSKYLYSLIFLKKCHNNSKHLEIFPQKKNPPAVSTWWSLDSPTSRSAPPQSIVDAKSCDRILFTQKTFGECFIAYKGIN